MSDLTAKQQLFIDEYLKCYNATQAAKMAGYKGNDNVLGVTGYDNLRNPKIASAIQRRLQESAMSADEVLARLADMARSNIADFSKVRHVSDLEEIHDKAHVAKKFKRTIYRSAYGSETETVELELYDAQSALEKIGRHHGLFTDKIEVKLAKELDTILATIEEVLDVDSYQRVLQAIVSGGEGGPEETRPGSGS